MCGRKSRSCIYDCMETVARVGGREGGREVSAIEYVHEALNGTGVEFNYTALSDV